MSPKPPDTGSSGKIPQERALAALRRAAQLQAEAAERLEQSSRALVTRRGATGADPDAFGREEVEAAASEAGIDPEYVRQALLEQQTLGDYAADLPAWVDRLGDRMLRSRLRSLELSRRIAAPPGAVLEAMQRVLPSTPYDMTLVDCVGGGPLEGGVLVFQLPRISAMTSAAASYTSFTYGATAVDLLQLHISLRPVHEGEREKCEVTLRGDLRVGIRRNVWAGLGASGLTGAVGGVVGALVGGLASGGIVPLLAAGAAIGIAGGGGVGGLGYGALYRYYLRKMVRELETLLQVVDANARTGGAFRSPHLSSGEGDASSFRAILGSM